MRLTNNTNGNYTTRQLKLPLEIEKLIDSIDEYNKKQHLDSLKNKANKTLDSKYLDEILKIRKGEM